MEKTITIARPVAEVYSFWSQLENLPRFMQHLEAVTAQDDLHSHWVMKMMGGKLLEWDAEIIERRENEMMSWRSIPGSDIESAGSVWFTSVPGGQGTLVRVLFKYSPPTGKAGHYIAKLFGRDAESELEDNLERLKELLETGHLEEKVSTLRNWQKRTTEATCAAARRVDGHVRENPWIYVASATALGVAFGMLLSRRRRAPEDFEEI